MKIKIVSQYYYPENFRVTDIAEELAAQGHSVSVLTGLPDYATGTVPGEYKHGKHRRETRNGVNITRVPIIERKTGAIRRALNYASFAITSSWYALTERKPQYDAIYVSQTSPVFQALAAVVYKKRCKAKLVLYCYDLWPESLKAWGLRDTNPAFRVTKAISAWLYNQCDIVAVTSKPFIEYLNQVCKVPHDKLKYLPQHCEDLYSDIAGQYQENGCIDFVFAGNIGAVQDVDVILKAAAMATTTQKFCVHIVGDGSELERLKLLADTLKLGDKVVFHGRYPLAQMREFYLLADCFLLTLRGGDFIGLTLPGKAQGYLTAGKPILAAIDGAGHELIIDADCGEVVGAGDVEGLAEKMQAVVEKHDMYKQKGMNGRGYYEGNFVKDRFIEGLLEVL